MEPSEAPGPFGAPVRRREDDRLLRGQGRFVADVRLPDQLTAVFVRSTRAHAVLRAVDVAAARRDPRTVAVISAADFPDGPPLLPSASGPVPGLVSAQPALATDRVRYVGEPVAVVVAADRYLAEDLAELVTVDYEPLPAVVDLDAALRPKAPVLHPGAGGAGGPAGGAGAGGEADGSPGRPGPPNVEQVVRADRGDVETALAAAPSTFSVRLSLARQAGAPLETRGLVASWDAAAGRLTLWTSTQIPHGVKDAVSTALGLPAEAVRVVLPDVGGAFGTKMQPYPEEFVVAWLSRRLGRPVGWIEDRAEHGVATTHGRDQHHDVEVGHDADGRILALRDRIASDIGAYSFTNAASEAIGTPAAVPGPYQVPAYAAESLAVFTNKTPSGSFRGVGIAPATFVMERIIDLVAARVGVDPAEVRLRNLVGPEQMPFDSGTTLHLPAVSIPWPAYDSGDYPALLRRALELVDYEELRREQARRCSATGTATTTTDAATDADGPGRWPLGIGLGMFVEPSGGGTAELSRVRVDEQGAVEVTAGIAPSGQGHQTMLAQIVADELCLAVENVVVRLGDTDRVRWGAGTMASRSAAVGGGAARLAARELRGRALPVAASLLGVPVTEVTLTGTGFARTDGTGPVLPWPEIARAHEVRTGERELAAEVEFRPAGTPFGYGVHVSVVEVDPGTGTVVPLRHLALDDCGTIVNPLLLAGQVHGGIGFAVGDALLGSVRYTPDGTPVDPAAGYPLPTASGMPAQLRVHHAEVPARTPWNADGVKGAGEGGVIGGTAAIANAVADAIAAATGTPRPPVPDPGAAAPGAVTRLPLTPPDVLRLLSLRRDVTSTTTCRPDHAPATRAP